MKFEQNKTLKLLDKLTLDFVFLLFGPKTNA